MNAIRNTHDGSSTARLTAAASGSMVLQSLHDGGNRRRDVAAYATVHERSVKTERFCNACHPSTTVAAAMI
jgi:hypothetical protein